MFGQRLKILHSKNVTRNDFDTTQCDVQNKPSKYNVDKRQNAF